MAKDHQYEELDKEEKKEKGSKCTCGKICCACICLILVAILIGLIFLTVTFGSQGYVAYQGYKKTKAVYSNLTSDNPDYLGLVTSAASPI